MKPFQNFLTDRFFNFTLKTAFSDSEKSPHEGKVKHQGKIKKKLHKRETQFLETSKQNKCADRDSNPGLGVGNA